VGRVRSQQHKCVTASIRSPVPRTRGRRPEIYTINRRSSPHTPPRPMQRWMIGRQFAPEPGTARQRDMRAQSAPRNTQMNRDEPRCRSEGEPSEKPWVYEDPILGPSGWVRYAWSTREMLPGYHSPVPAASPVIWASIPARSALFGTIRPSLPPRCKFRGNEVEKGERRQHSVRFDPRTRADLPARGQMWRGGAL
jgi:hypothetical protein